MTTPADKNTAKKSDSHTTTTDPSGGNANNEEAQFNLKEDENLASDEQLRKSKPFKSFGDSPEIQISDEMENVERPPGSSNVGEVTDKEIIPDLITECKIEPEK